MLKILFALLISLVFVNPASALALPNPPPLRTECTYMAVWQPKRGQTTSTIFKTRYPNVRKCPATDTIGVGGVIHVGHFQKRVLYRDNK